METATLTAPVTCLEFFQDQLLLTGEGPFLSVYSLLGRPKAVTSLSILQQYRIHGIRIKKKAFPFVESPTTETPEPREHEQMSCDLAVFGGKSVRLVRLHMDFHKVNCLHLEVLGPLLELQDWALDVHWLSRDNQSLLCVALAHNGAVLLDAATGNLLIQRFCLEGCLLYSALLLVHEAWDDTVLVGGTVFNQLIIWKPGEGSGIYDSGHKAPVEQRLQGHSGVIFSIAYLQEEGYLASASDDRSVRVWGVGALGGPGGKCGALNPACLRVLYGHQARVFSVRFSLGKVFSAGEDGACLVWDLSEGSKVICRLKGHRAGGVRALAVSIVAGDGERWVATGGADGGVRLWKVEDRENKTDIMDGVGTESLIDLKFPGPGLPKVVCDGGGEDEKTSWSNFLVCTDTGAICQYSGGEWGTLLQAPPEFVSYCVMDTATAFVKDSATRVSLCAVGNLSGSILVFLTSDPLSTIHLKGGSGKIHTIIWHKGRENTYLLASGSEGLVYRWCIEVKANEMSSFVITARPLPPFLLPRCSKRWLTAIVRPHSCSNEVLWVCGDRRGSLLLYREWEHFQQNVENTVQCPAGVKFSDCEQEDANNLGGRMKEEEVELPKVQPLSCLFGVHGKHGVTSVREYNGLFHSTGKDGCVRIFRVHHNPTAEPQPSQQECAENVEKKGELQLEVLRVQRACKGMEWLERILFLEPESPEEVDEFVDKCNALNTNLAEKLQIKKGEQNFAGKEQQEGRFVIAGFHAAHFVIWDPVRQESLMAVPCGGGHRSWSLWPAHAGIWPGYGALIFIKQGTVLTSQPPGDALGWVGKAGKTRGWCLREGIHGRGIWCVCWLGRIKEEQEVGTEKEERYWEVVVTGGEDTSLAILALNTTCGVIKILTVITDHISGVRSVTAATRPEGNHLSALVVSAGGRAQIQCYRVLVAWDRRRQTPSCQVIQLASHRLDLEWEKRRNRHKTVKMDPETRYVSVEVLEEKENCVIIALACSDGAIRLFSVSEAGGQMELLWETFYHQRCVLSVVSCSLESESRNRSKLLFSAATDGKIAVWHFSAASSKSTDNSCVASTSPVPLLDIPAHQSGVNSLAVWVEELGQQECGCLVTVASGGDDGQLTVSTVRVQYPEVGKSGGSGGFANICKDQGLKNVLDQSSEQLKLHLLTQTHIPLAHAASITALKLLSPGLLVSTSSDQRVCLWRVDSTRISHAGALFSHVADPAGLTVWESDGEENKGLETEQVKTVKSAAVCPSSDVNETGKNGGVEGEGSCPSRKEAAKLGWVLVCGQGLELLRLRNTDMDPEMMKKQEKKDARVKVTFIKQES